MSILTFTALQTRIIDLFIWWIKIISISILLERAGSKLHGNLKHKCSWHDLMMSVLLALNKWKI